LWYKTYKNKIAIKRKKLKEDFQIKIFRNKNKIEKLYNRTKELLSDKKNLIIIKQK